MPGTANASTAAGPTAIPTTLRSPASKRDRAAGPVAACASC
jgi:hypothetical protein